MEKINLKDSLRAFYKKYCEVKKNLPIISFDGIEVGDVKTLSQPGYSNNFYQTVKKNDEMLHILLHNIYVSLIDKLENQKSYIKIDDFFLIYDSSKDESYFVCHYKQFIFDCKCEWK